MDFKAALQAEIETKKRQFNKLSSENNSTSSKSVKVADVEKQKQEEYMEKQKTLDYQRQVKVIGIHEPLYLYNNTRKNWMSVYQESRSPVRLST